MITSPPLTILFLNPNGQCGGAERSLLDLMASICAARPDWTLQLIVSEDGPLVASARAIGSATTVIPFPAALSMIGDAGVGSPTGSSIGRLGLLTRLLMAIPETGAYILRLRSAISAAAPHVVHTNGFKMHVLGPWAMPCGLPLVWNIRDYVSTRPVMSRLMRAQAARCSAAVTNSESVANDLRAVFGVRQRRVFTVHNAIDLEQFCPKGDTFDLDGMAKMSRSENGVVRVGLVAAMARWKGHEVFLKALSMLPNTIPFRGYVIGGPLYRTAGSQYQLDELRQAAAQLGISDRVGFPGFVSDPAAAMRSLDIVVHASTKPEPFGRVIVEGMACGRAVVASLIGGASEVVSEGVDALGHRPGDAASLACCLGALIANPSLRASLGKAGRNSVEHRFDRVLLAKKFVPIYREVASRLSI